MVWNNAGVSLVAQDRAVSWVRPGDAPLPPGCTLALSPQSRLLDEGLLVGGTPLRVLKLSDPGADIVSRWRNGEPLSDSPSEQRLARQVISSGVMLATWEESLAPLSQVSVVIPHRNRTAALDALLGSLRAHKVIVVDDASDNPAAVATVCAEHGAQLIVRSAQGGPGATRNEGLVHVTTPFVFFLDSDCTFDATQLAVLLAHMNDPHVAVVAPRVIGSQGSSKRAHFERDASPLDLGGQPALARPGGLVGFVPAAGILCRTALGPTLFDESLDGGEDVDLIWRLNSLGWLTRYEPGVVLEHAMRASLVDWIGQRRFYGATAAELEARHGEAAAPLRGSPWTLAAWGLIGLGHPASGLVSLGIGIESLRKRLTPLTERPGPLAWELTQATLLDHLPRLARSLVRTYGPFLVIGALFSPRLRRLATLSYLVAGIDRWRSTKSDLDLASFVAYATLDDLSYGIGVIEGAVKTRRLGALLPHIVRAVPAPRSRKPVSR